MRIRRWTTGALVALLAVPLVIAAGASPAKAASGPYSGSAHGDLIHANAVNTPDLLPGVADIHLAVSDAQVNSTGLTGQADKRSSARATNLDAPLLAAAIDLNPLLTTASQVAPPNADADAQSLTGLIDLSPVAAIEVASATAHARWAGDGGCIPPGQPISSSRSTLVDASVLTGLGDPIGDALISLDNDNGGASYSNSSVGLVDVAGQSNKGLKSESIVQVDGIVLFKGSENETTLNVVAPPRLTAVATGNAATTDVTYSEPIIQIIQGGEVTDVLSATDLQALNLDLPGGDPIIVRLELGTLEGVTKSATGASGSASLLRLRVLDVTGTITLADVSIAPMTVAATVPVGGITCSDPLANLQVDASTPIVLPGGSFEYAVTIPNIGDCTIEHVKVVLTVTGPGGTTISGTDPAATIDGLTATWADIGAIAPGALKTVKATIKVPTNAPSGAAYKGTATASGSCAGANVSHTADSGPIPTVGAPSGSACDLSGSGISSSHKEVRIGDYFNEYVRLTNLGKGTCNAIKVTLPYPPDTTFVSCTDACAHDDAKRVVTWTIPSLGSGVSKDLVATFKVATTGKPGENLGTTVTITSGSQRVTDTSKLPVITSSNVLNNGAQRARGLLARTGADLPTGLALTVLGVFLGLRGLRRRRNG